MAGVRLFFATDIHGSESCFKKFVYASKSYKCNIIIMGGDITGKKIIPLVRQPDNSYACEWLGQRRSLKTKGKDELERLKTDVRSVGSYPVRWSQKTKRWNFLLIALEFEALSTR